MHQRSALQAGEHRRVDLLGQRLVVGEDHGAARAAQRLVRGRGHDMGVRERARMRAAGDQPREMRHVDHQEGADLVGNGAEGGKVDGARIGAAARHDHLRLVLPGEAAHLVHVDAVVLPAHRVGHHLEPLARHVDGRAVRQVPAGGEAEAHEGVAGLHQRHERRLVGGAARVRLHVGEAAAEQLLGPLDGQQLRPSTYWQPP